ncbi:Hypothetical predicted protein [Olea europaea subsp. europaea]|uniref:Uncharacterized protein n=1 Tax=Olea europaea subsp. europaea TaxID=158383 RepID=A0A8S0PKV7_OLEEU|nr:Hypothetical predicted protein [Olea europaea subsp. europaea]
MVSPGPASTVAVAWRQPGRSGAKAKQSRSKELVVGAAVGRSALCCLCKSRAAAVPLPESERRESSRSAVCARAGLPPAAVPLPESERQESKWSIGAANPNGKGPKFEDFLGCCYSNSSPTEPNVYCQSETVEINVNMPPNLDTCDGDAERGENFINPSFFQPYHYSLIPAGGQIETRGVNPGHAANGVYMYHLIVLQFQFLDSSPGCAKLSFRLKNLKRRRISVTFKLLL